MLRIGMLTPRSTLYPAMGFDILNGFKAGLAQYNLTNDVVLFTENIGFGTDEPEIYTKAEKMILGDNADIVIACCDSRIAAMLQPLFTAAGKLLVVVNMGANLPESWQAHESTIVHSLNFCFNTALTGALAAAGKTAALAASYFDAGYNQVFSMLTRFQQKGGSILFNHITHLETAKFTLQPLQQFMAGENGTPNLLCLFSADMAALFYKEMATIQQNQPCNLFVSPMMLEETLAKELKNEVPFKNVQGYTPWQLALSNANNQQFTAAYQAAQGKQPNLFVLLGWDTALVVDCFAKQLTATGNNTVNAIKAMGTVPPLPSPRGWIKLDTATNHIYGPAWLVKGSNYPELEIAENNSLDMDAEWKNFTSEVALAPDGLHSAWRNTYLCI
jgi:branched-chain amino acid transport system substrate-binding protein